MPNENRSPRNCFCIPSGLVGAEVNGAHTPLGALVAPSTAVFLLDGRPARSYYSFIQSNDMLEEKAEIKTLSIAIGFSIVY